MRHTFGLFQNVQVAVERNFNQGFDDCTVQVSTDAELLEVSREVLTENRDRPFFGWIHFINPRTPYP